MFRFFDSGWTHGWTGRLQTRLRLAISPVTRPDIDDPAVPTHHKSIGHECAMAVRRVGLGAQQAKRFPDGEQALEKLLAGTLEQPPIAIAPVHLERKE